MCLGIQATVLSKYVDEVGFKMAHVKFADGVFGETCIEVVWDEVNVNDKVIVISQNAMQVVDQEEKGELEQAAKAVYA